MIMNILSIFAVAATAIVDLDLTDEQIDKIVDILAQR